MAEKNPDIIPNGDNFDPRAKVWRMRLAKTSKQTCHGTFGSSSGQTEVKYKSVLGEKLAPVWVEHLPLQYEALTGHGDTTLTIEDSIDSTLLKPADQMSHEELIARGLMGVSINNGCYRTFYGIKRLAAISEQQLQIRLVVKESSGQTYPATYNKTHANITYIMNSPILPILHKPPKETI